MRRVLPNPAEGDRGGKSSASCGQQHRRSRARRQRHRIWPVGCRVRSVIGHVNGPTVHDEAQMPFGGAKASGYGRFGGKAGIAEFTELRWITIETGPQHYPI
jgi:acyl-CoA reductase-like NAD-dependent aldehyde dehydrogenase